MIGVCAAYLPIHLVGSNARPAGTAVVTLFYVTLLGGLVCVALALGRLEWLRKGGMAEQGWRPCRAWLHDLRAVLVVLLVWRVKLTAVWAHMLFQQAQAHQDAEQLDRGIDLYRRAWRMAPRQDLYHPFLGQPYMLKASGDENALV